MRNWRIVDRYRWYFLSAAAAPAEAVAAAEEAGVAAAKQLRMRTFLSSESNCIRRGSKVLKTISDSERCHINLIQYNSSAFTYI